MSPHEQSLSETHSHTFISIKIIFHSSSLSQEIINNNDNNNHHSNTFIVTDSVFLKTQIQMLYDMMTQTRNESYAEIVLKLLIQYLDVSMQQIYFSSLMLIYLTVLNDTNDIQIDETYLDVINIS